MGDTFRRISLNQRRKQSIVNPELKIRKRSVFEYDNTTRVETAESLECRNSRKISRPYLKITEQEQFPVRTKVYMTKEQNELFGENEEIQIKGRRDGDEKMAQGHKVNEVLAAFRSLLAGNEVMIQIIILLPIMLTALYIIFVEKGRLFVAAANAK